MYIYYNNSMILSSGIFVRIQYSSYKVSVLIDIIRVCSLLATVVTQSNVSLVSAHSIK